MTNIGREEEEMMMDVDDALDTSTDVEMVDINAAQEEVSVDPTTRCVGGEEEFPRPANRNSRRPVIKVNTSVNAISPRDDAVADYFSFRAEICLTMEMSRDCCALRRD